MTIENHVDIYEMAETAKVMIGDDRYDDIVMPYLELACQKVLERLYPFEQDKDVDDIPARYSHIVCEIAVYLVNKRGAEGETTHSENGTSRTYPSGGVPNALFSGITPFVGVPR